MSFPSKDSYPQWVKWLAQDKDGCWWGFSVEPLEHHKGWYENEVGRYILIKRDNINLNWKETLTKVNS